MERRDAKTQSSISTHPAPLMMICSGRRRLVNIGKIIQPSLPCRTAANGEAMLGLLRSSSHSIIAAVDIDFLDEFGVNCLRRCTRSPAIFAIIVYGISNDYDEMISSIYRYPITDTVYGYNIDLIRDKALAAWHRHSKSKSAHFN